MPEKLKITRNARAMARVWVPMRWRLLLVAVSAGLASCGGGDRSAEDLANNADLLNEATVNAILGADLPPDELEPSNEMESNAASDNAGDGGNAAD